MVQQYLIIPDDINDICGGRIVAATQANGGFYIESGTATRKILFSDFDTEAAMMTVDTSNDQVTIFAVNDLSFNTITSADNTIYNLILKKGTNAGDISGTVGMKFATDIERSWWWTSSGSSCNNIRTKW